MAEHSFWQWQLLMFRLRALLALGRRTDATTTAYNNTSSLVHFTIANHNCNDTISGLYLAVIYAYYTSFSVYIPHCKLAAESKRESEMP